jgi:hypothetical protein
MRRLPWPLLKSGGWWMLSMPQWVQGHYVQRTTYQPPPRGRMIKVTYGSLSSQVVLNSSPDNPTNMSHDPILLILQQLQQRLPHLECDKVIGIINQLNHLPISPSPPETTIYAKRKRRTISKSSSASILLSTTFSSFCAYSNFSLIVVLSGLPINISKIALLSSTLLTCLGKGTGRSDGVTGPGVDAGEISSVGIRN